MKEFNIYFFDCAGYTTDELTVNSKSQARTIIAAAKAAYKYQAYAVYERTDKYTKRVNL